MVVPYYTTITDINYNHSIIRSATIDLAPESTNTHSPDKASSTLTHNQLEGSVSNVSLILNLAHKTVKIIEETSVFISKMISQTDTQTLGPTNTATTNHATSNLIRNGKSSKGFGVKKKRKFDETIIDGFAITAFKTWEDLQDELNERTSLNNSIINSNNNNNTPINSNPNITDATNNIDDTFDTNCTAHKKASSRKSKHKKNSSNSSSTSANSESSLSNNSTTIDNLHLKEGGGKNVKDKSKKSAGHSQSVSSKDKRNKSSSEKTSLKRALEAKELAEKRLSILQEKLKQEQSKNRSHDINHKPTPPIIQENYSSPQFPSSNVHIRNETHSRSNGMLGHETLPDHHQIPKQTPYSPYHINSHLQRPPESIIHQTIHNHIQTPPSPPRIHNSHSQSQHQHMKHQSLSHQASSPIVHQVNQHQSQKPSSPPPQPHPHQPHTQYPRPSQPAPHPNPIQQPNPHPPPQSMPHSHPHPHLLHQTQPSPLNPYSHTPATSMMSSMGLGSLPSPYSCPPSIYITDTISRQTSIIPPIVPSLEQSASLGPASRYGHSGVMHSVTPYTPPVPPHHSMYYPTLPTERSFIEFARSYTGPGHIGYPNMMSSFPTPSSHTTANPYNFDRWPRIPLEHQRAVSRYNSLYQSTTTIPDRSYPSYPRPPMFPAGLFVSRPQDRLVQTRAMMQSTN